MLETFLSTGDFFIRCALSLVLGAMIGLEREYKNKPAGLKTHTLICVGSTALTYLSIHFSPQGDPGRIAAQIVSGIGFIGGGAILQSRKAVKGLTTAATLWVAASVGMLIGGHFFIPAILLSILVTLFLIFARPFSTMEKLQKNYVTTIQFKQIEIGEKIITLAKKFQLWLLDQ